MGKNNFVTFGSSSLPLIYLFQFLRIIFSTFSDSVQPKKETNVTFSTSTERYLDLILVNSNTQKYTAGIQGPGTVYSNFQHSRVSFSKSALQYNQLPKII